MLWDTSTLIDYLREVPVAVQYFEEIRQAVEPPYCSVITEAEIWAGNRDAREELLVGAALSYFTILPIGTAVARLAGSLLKGKSSREIRAHFGDALIAATALQYGETVLTADAASQRVFGHQVNYQVYQA